MIYHNIKNKVAAALIAFLAAQAPRAQDSAFNKVLSEVQVKSSPNRATEAAVSRSVRGSHLVSDGVSVEFLKRTPDRTLADALRRVSGLTVQGDRFVLVRGLADRYNSATLNRSPLPSTEPDRRAFSFDLIPTSLIDNVIVAKSPSANLPGDWSGGLVQVTTRDAADNSATLSLGVGAGSVSTLRGFELTPRVPFPSSFPTTNRFRTATTGDRRAYTKLVGSPGDWGGVVILGRATTNRASEPTIEGGIGRPYGGQDDDDNSGVLRYVRIEYAGVAAMPNSEINALTLGAVGRGTTIEYVQTIYANDDAFEFFGGTVNCRNLYAWGTADDDYDFDFGYRGTIQNGVARRDPQFVDNGDAGNGVECDNDGTGSSAQPFTHPRMVGMVLVGPNDPAALGNHNLGLRFRRATRFSITDSKVLGYQKGSLSVESNETAQALKDGTSTFRANEVQSFDPTLNFRSTSSLITAAEMRAAALALGSRETSYTKAQMDSLARPGWSAGWTRMPARGF